MEVFDKYIDDVLANTKGRHGELEILSVKRHLDDLERDDIYFDNDEADRIIKIIQLFRFTKGKFANKKVTLQPYQVFFFRCLFGWKKLDGTRRFRKVYKEIARKNGKTEEMGWLAIIMLRFDREEAPEVYTAATKRDQARICFDATEMMMRKLMNDSTRIKSSIKIYRNSINYPAVNGLIKPLSSDTKGMDGLNPSCGLIDEYHAHSSSAVLKLIETGMGMRENPILAITTTAGFNKNYPCYAYRQTCVNVLTGVMQDDTLFVQIFSMDPDDDWEDPNNWYKPNPNLGNSINEERLFEDYKSAKNEGETAIVEFKTKRLNVWTNTASAFISDKLFEANSGDIDYSGRCMVGIDLAYIRDIVAIVVVFENRSVLCKFYVPKSKVDTRDNTDGVDYLQWVKDGYLTVTPGNAIDYDYILEDLLDIEKEYKPDAYIYDPWNSSQFIQSCINRGIDENRLFKVAQGPKTYTEVINTMERDFILKRYSHGNNPVLRWMFSNVEVELKSNKGKIFKKKGEKNKIDGVQAMGMAVKGFIEFPEEEIGVLIGAL